jgi:hypothetical protein
MAGRLVLLAPRKEEMRGGASEEARVRDEARPRGGASEVGEGRAPSNEAWWAVAAAR